LHTIDTRRMHDAYEQMSDKDRDIIDEAFTKARGELHQICSPALDDRAEELVAAIAYYVLRSREDRK